MRHQSDISDSSSQETRDPFGLGELPLLEPDQDGWAQVKAALETDRASPLSQRRRRRLGIGLAMAASLLLAIGVTRHQANPDSNGPIDEAPVPVDLAQIQQVQDQDAEVLQDLIAMSQSLEQRLRLLRDQTSSIPSESAVYIAEIEDLVARVDGQLGVQPQSLDLWTKRVKLMLDLEFLFQHQFEREYGRMASL